MVDSTFARTQMQAFLDVRKDKVMSGWGKKLCVLSGTRLLMYKGENKSVDATVLKTMMFMMY